jgi:nucleoside diphosphate kinase
LKIEETLTIIKPGNFKYCLEIFECLDDWMIKLGGDFSRTRPVHLYKVPEDIIREHYKHISIYSIYEPTIKAFVESKDGIVLIVYRGKNVIQRGRTAIGDKDPQKAEQGTIRQIFSNDSLEKAKKEVRYLNNVIHASDEDNAKREIRLWGDYLIE